MGGSAAVWALAALVVAACAGAAAASSASLFVYLDHNHDQACGMPCGFTPSAYNYSCSFDATWASGRASFLDPLPANAQLLSLSVSISGWMHCVGYPIATTYITPSLNSLELTAAAHTGGADCTCGGQCNGPVVSTTVFDQPLSNGTYNYGGMNSISLGVSGDTICVGGYALAMEYQVAGGERTYACCLYMNSTLVAHITCTLPEYGCTPQAGRSLMDTWEGDGCDVCWGLDEARAGRGAQSGARRGNSVGDGQTVADAAAGVTVQGMAGVRKTEQTQARGGARRKVRVDVQ